MSQNREVLLPTTEVAPQKALSNIRESEKENLNPDAYVEMETEIKQNPREPSVTVSEPVAEAMTSSTQHAQVMKEDAPVLGEMGSYFDYTKLVFEGKSLNDELATLSYRRSTGERLTEEEEFKILTLNSQAQDLQKAKDKYDFSFAESFPAEVVGASYDLADTFRDNYGLILGATGVGAGTGAGIGALSFTPMGVGAGVLLGGAKGLALGTGAAFVKHTYIQSTGQIYNELSYGGGEPLPEQTKVSIARGAGALSAAVTLALPVLKFGKNTPFLKKLLNPKAYVKGAMKNPATRSLLMRLAGSTGAAEAGEESIQEVIQIFAGELGATWDGTETSFNEALKRTATMDTAERALKAAALGGVAGQTMQKGLDIATAPLNRVMGEFGAIQEAKSDVTSDGQIPTNAKGVRAVQLKHALDQHLKLTEDTNTKTMLPEKMAEIRQKHFEDAGTAAIYVDKAELNAWADSDEKAALALEMIGEEGLTASEIDSPLRIETHKFLKIAEDHPEITNLVKADPTGPSAMTFLMNIEEINARREAITKEIDAELEGAPDIIQDPKGNNLEITRTDTGLEVIHEGKKVGEVKIGRVIGEGVDQEYISNAYIDDDFRSQELAVKLLDYISENQIADLQDTEDSTSIQDLFIMISGDDPNKLSSNAWYRNDQDSKAKRQEKFDAHLTNVRNRMSEDVETETVDATAKTRLENQINKLKKEKVELEVKPVEYDYKSLDVSESTKGKVFYHGTSGKLDKLSDADVFQFSTVQNLFGEGLYLTDDVVVAENYAKSRREGEGKVLSTQLNDLKLYDLEKPLPSDVHAVLSEYIKEHEGDPVSESTIGSLVYDELKSTMAESQLTTSEVQEIYGEINDKLSELGYDGLRHEGGQRSAKGGLHNVVVLFENLFSDGSGRSLKDKLSEVTKTEQPKFDTDKIKKLEQQLADLEDVELGEKRIRDGDISGEEAFLEQQTFTKDMEEVLPAKEIIGLNEAEINARVEVVENIKADIESEVAIELNARYEAKVIEEQDRAAKEYGPNVEVVESFLNSDKTIGELSAEQVKLKKKNLPIHSIDPDHLTLRLRTKYEDDPVMRARKVFRKGGMHPEQVATIYNQKSVEDFLKLISETPTREQLISTELENIENNIKEDTETIAELENTKLDKAFDNISKLHLKTGKILRDAYWSKFKKGVKRIALDITRLETQIQKRAKDSIGKTKISTINVNQWVVAARRSQRKAVDAFLDGKFEEGFRQKQNAAYATQLVKEARIANRKVNKAMKYIVKVTTDPRYRAELQEAGPDYTGSIEYFTDVFNFSPNKKRQSDIKQYKKYLKELEKRGEVNQAIPPEVLVWLEPQANPNDMTVDQLLYVADKMKTVMHTARLKNRLYNKDEVNTIEMIADNLHEYALTNPEYKDERINEPIGTVPAGYKVGQALSIAESLITNNQFLVQELDQNKLNGLYAKLLHQPITGAGESQGPTGLIAKAKLLGAYSKRFQDAIIKHYGSQKAFRNLGITKVDIPELAHLPGSKGKFTKDQLLMILANMGNIENKAYVENFGVDADAMMDILTKYLTKQDFDFVQDGMWNAFKTLAPRIDAVHKSTEGVSLDFVKPESFEAFGTTYEGGYFPIMIDKELNFIEESKLIGQKLTDLESYNPLKKVNASFNAPAYEGIVRSPHTKERVGSDYTISLDMNRFSRALDDVIHDITMREPVRDVMTLVNDPLIKGDMIKQIGRIKYNTFVNNVAQLTNSASANNLQLHGKLQNGMSKVFSKVEGAFAINYIAFNLNSILMSSLVLPQIALKMGPKNFAKYGSQVALKIGGAAAKFNKTVFVEAYNLAAELDPSLELYRHGIDDYVESAMSKDIPKQRLVNWKPYAAAKHGQEVAVEFAFSRILGGLDTVMKVYTTVAAYNMYIAGDAKGHTYYDVHHGKTQEEVHRDAKAYVGQLLENTTMRASQYDKSALQNNSLGRQFTRFWNESRNVINNVIGEGRSIKGDAKKMSDHAKAGDYMKANMAFNDAGGNMMTVFGIMMASQAFMNAARERDPFLTPEDKDEGEDGTLGGFIGYQLSNPGELASNYIGGTVPVLRDILYAADSADRDATPRFAVSVPLLAAFNDIAAARNIPGVVLTEIQDGATFMEAMSELKVKEQRALINTVGYMVGGLPGANQILKLNAWMEDEDISLPSLNFINQEFVKSVDTYVSSKRPNEEAEFQKLLELSEKGVTTLTDAMLDDLTLIRDQIAPLPKGEVLSQFGYDIIKQVESGGKWNATPGTSSAYGIYQFTEGTWKDQMATPEGRAAGLTLNGRLSKNPRQQEAAMKIFTKSNSIKLVKLNVPVNLETLYFAHHFGAWKAEYVYGPSIKNDKIKMSKKVLTSEVLTANPKLVTLKVRTVGDMKKYIRDILNDGKDELTNSQP